MHGPRVEQSYLTLPALLNREAGANVANPIIVERSVISSANRGEVLQRVTSLVMEFRGVGNKLASLGIPVLAPSLTMPNGRHNRGLITHRRAYLCGPGLLGLSLAPGVVCADPAPQLGCSGP